MTTLNDFNKVDGVTRVMAAHVNDLIASTMRSEYSNVETLSGTRTLLDLDTPIQRFDCNGSNRIVLCPTANTEDNHPFLLVNASDGGETITVKDNAGSVTLATVAEGDSVFILPDGDGAYKVVGNVFAVIAGNGISVDSTDPANPIVTATEWQEISETWTYASASTITVATDATTRFRKGVKIRLKQGGAYKYFSASSVAATLITVFVNTDYTVANAAITDVAISYDEYPDGWPVWFARTPTISASGSMTISSSTLTFARYKPMARSVLEEISYSAITLGGTASTDIRVSTVVAPAQDLVVFTANVANNGGAQEISTGLIIQAGPYFRCRRNLAANYTVAAGAQCYINAEYEY